MTYNVFGGTLNLALSIYLLRDTLFCAQNSTGCCGWVTVTSYSASCVPSTRQPCFTARGLLERVLCFDYTYLITLSFTMYIIT